MGFLVFVWFSFFFPGITISMFFLLLVEHGNQLSSSGNIQISAKK